MCHSIALAWRVYEKSLIWAAMQEGSLAQQFVQKTLLSNLHPPSLRSRMKLGFYALKLHVGLYGPSQPTKGYGFRLPVNFVICAEISTHTHLFFCSHQKDCCCGQESNPWPKRAMPQPLQQTQSTFYSFTPVPKVVCEQITSNFD